MEILNQLPKDSVISFEHLKKHLFTHENLEKHIQQFWTENPVFHQLLTPENDLDIIRRRVYNYLADYERKALNNHANLKAVERNISRRCIGVLKNIFSRRSEELTDFSVLLTLVKLAHHQPAEISISFVEELRRLFLGMKGSAGISRKVVSMEHSDRVDHRLAGQVRSENLNVMAGRIAQRVRSYPNGLAEGVIRVRRENQARIMAYFGVGSEEWNDWQWQYKNAVRDARVLGDLIKLTPREKAAVERAIGHGLPFGITPYYLTLMDAKPHRTNDHAVRAQVIPPLEYVENVLMSQHLGVDMDFMGEKDTSPVDLVTRRYPMIAIFKPYNTCAQICVYCQRNWEITDVHADNAQAGKSKLDLAMDWIAENTALNEILVTGGDPGLLTEAMMKKILDRLSGFEHIRRIRIGTRLPVVLPMRISDAYADLLARYVEPGRREVVVMTHFEHPYEVTPESMQAVQTLKKRGISVYNQTVFTMENARRFEMVSLRQLLRKIGVDPYYTFNTKGKEETKAYRVPIARLIQEQTEEARLTPGLDRSDEAVFNIPRLGKNYLRAAQDHEVIMIKPNGARVYEFFPWDHEFADTKPYVHEDVPILDFLVEMYRRGEDPEDYKTIWYYL